MVWRGRGAENDDTAVLAWGPELGVPGIPVNSGSGPPVSSLNAGY